MELQHGNEGILNCPLSGLRTSVSEMTVSSVSMAMPSNLANPFLSSSAWDPLVPLTQTFGGFLVVSDSEFANSSYPHVLENKRMSYESQFVQYISDLNYVDMTPKVHSFDQTGASEFGIKRGSINNEQYENEGSTPEQGETGSASGEHRRKRGLVYDSTLSPNKNADGEAVKDSTKKGSDDVKEQCEKKPKVEQNSSAKLIGKQSMKPKKDDSDSGEAPRENFIHVRSRRGQATNSHSLAERVRREKISERMRLLQELVPGCNKITGKAVMLDEIINYVQSLQQQVKFLSMKLATVNPELNFNVEQIHSKDPHVGHGPVGGYGPGISYTGPFPSMPQCILDQSFYRMSYNSSTDLDNLGNSGC